MTDNFLSNDSIVSKINKKKQEEFFKLVVRLVQGGLKLLCSLCRGKYPISRFLWKTKHKVQRELENLKLVEATLDGLIKTCAQQLFDMTDDMESSAYPFTAGQRSAAGLLVTEAKREKSIVLNVDLKMKLLFFNLSSRRPT